MAGLAGRKPASGLGSKVAGPGGGQTVRTNRELAAESDAIPHLYPHAGLLRANQTAKPLLSWMRMCERDAGVKRRPASAGQPPSA